MFNALKTAALAGLVGLTALAAVPAKADGVYLGLRRRRRHASMSIERRQRSRLPPRSLPRRVSR